ncbi:MAG: flagellar biosynthesis protein FlhB [Stagnimonas sp.]|nr:flagellar biosynthesis protein FlhB [Stagnimonas sp.]
MTDSAQDRTERATPKRRADARKKGQLPRSRELSAAAVVLAGAGGVLAWGGSAAAKAGALLRDSFASVGPALDDPSQLPRLAGAVVAQGFAPVLPILAVTTVAALAAPLLIGGWNFAPGAAAPDLARVNPLSGLKRVFSSNSLAELFKALLKFLLIAGIAAGVIWGDREHLLALSTLPTTAAIAAGLRLALDALLWMGGGLLLIAAIDVPWQLYQYAKQLRMSKQDVREEYKQSEGKPEVKARIRRLQQEMANARMMEKVPTADVVVTNPTHYAVALAYSAGKDRAPRVVAKGADEIARRIRELAAENKVPLVEAPPLARALYRGCALEDEIPAGLYQAVAQVLSYVYQLRELQRGRRRGTAPAPPRIDDSLPNGQPD